ECRILVRPILLPYLCGGRHVELRVLLSVLASLRTWLVWFRSRGLGRAARTFSAFGLHDYGKTVTERVDPTGIHHLRFECQRLTYLRVRRQGERQGSIAFKKVRGSPVSGWFERLVVNLKYGHLTGLLVAPEVVVLRISYEGDAHLRIHVCITP